MRVHQIADGKRVQRGRHHIGQRVGAAGWRGEVHSGQRAPTLVGEGAVIRNDGRVVGIVVIRICGRGQFKLADQVHVADDFRQRARTGNHHSHGSERVASDEHVGAQKGFHPVGVEIGPAMDGDVELVSRAAAQVDALLRAAGRNHGTHAGVVIVRQAVGEDLAAVHRHRRAAGRDELYRDHADTFGKIQGRRRDADHHRRGGFGVEVIGVLIALHGNYRRDCVSDAGIG